MDRSPEVHSAPGESNKDRTHLLKGASIPPGEELTGVGSAVPIVHSSVTVDVKEDDSKNLRQYLGSMQHLHMHLFLLYQQIFLFFN